MPVQEIIKLGDITDEEKRLSLLLAIHCAPVLSGIKAANMVTVTQNEYIGIKYILQGTDISCRFLKTGKDRGILYLYREKELVSYLHLKEIEIFLEEYGYLSNDLDVMLGHLEKRMDSYCKGEILFPHEIGVFLEYPLTDVTGFLENKGKDFIYSGYWKVYHDAPKAVRKFTQYDTVRYRMVRAVASGWNIQEIMEISASWRNL
ncbi:MAG: DUF3793 family protein [Lachnospiraceae bacterium]|nr:DUF3793 family protein [Lachnospiraceae bacterium]